MKKRIVTLSLCIILFFTGCTTAQINQNIGKIAGTTIGVGVGAVIGKKAGGKKGAIIGSVIGGEIGYFIGDEIDERRNAVKKIAKEKKIKVEFTYVKNDNGKKVGQSFITQDVSQFNSGSHYLNSHAKDYFRNVAKLYVKSKQKVLIIGHTDDQGSDIYNQALSERRSKTVSNLFARYGVDAKSIYFYGLGEGTPISTNKTSKGRSKNRRVGIVEAPTQNDIAKYAYSKRTNSSLLSKKPRSEKPTNQKPRKIAKAPENPIKNVNSTKKDNPKPLLGKEVGKSEDNVSINVDGDLSLNIDGNLSIKLDGDKVLHFGSGSPEKYGVCKNDYWFTPKKKKPVFSSGARVVSNLNQNGFEEVVGYPVVNDDFSFVTKAYANTESAFSSSCLEDSFRKKGTITNLASGERILLEKTLDQIPWLDGTLWFSEIENKILVVSPINISIENVEPMSCPHVSLINKGANQPNYGTSTKVVTRQGDKGFLYRIYPSIPHKNAPFECIDIAFSDKQSSKAKGNIYFKKNSKYYKKDVNFKLLAKKAITEV